MHAFWDEIGTDGGGVQSNRVHKIVCWTPE